MLVNGNIYSFGGEKDLYIHNNNTQSDQFIYKWEVLREGIQVYINKVYSNYFEFTKDREQIEEEYTGMKEHYIFSMAMDSSRNIYGWGENTKTIYTIRGFYKYNLHYYIKIHPIKISKKLLLAMIFMLF